MQTYLVRLEAPVFKTFRCQRAANSVDLDVEKKAVHELSVKADLETPFNVGLILGSSGSGKTTLAKKIFGDDCFKSVLKDDLPIIDQLPEDWSYEMCSEALHGVGLTSVNVWVKPVGTLSNGQRARAEAVLLMAHAKEMVCIDEWTSVVDRTVAKVMSHCVQKFARRTGKKLILLSCHYDVIEWLNPDWVIDCNKAEFTDRRLLRPDERKRTEQLVFDIRPVERSTWRNFAKYHYLSDRLPGGKVFCFGIFSGENQIGFQCFANYVPKLKGARMQYHSNRTVIHPDYAGLGLGIRVINLTSQFMLEKHRFEIRAVFSSEPIFKAMSKQKEWAFIGSKRILGKQSKGNLKGIALRESVKQYSFKYVGLASASLPSQG